MITNKDIRVDNGNLVLNGDKFPLDGQSPEAIMEIVEDNSDSTPTENSTAPITSGGVYTALGAKQDTLTFDTAPTENSTNPVESGGVYSALAGKQDAIITDATAGAYGVNDTYQLSSAIMARDLIVIGVSRAGCSGSIAMPIEMITGGRAENGIKIVTVDATDPTSDKVVVLSISNTGLLTVKYLSNILGVYLVIKAI